jgi:hypothetical protein
MHFDILGTISQVETFATGSGIREITRLRRLYGRGRWRSARASPAFDWPMARSISLKYTGMKPPASGGRNSRSSTYFDAEIMAKAQAKQLVVCVNNDGYLASLERRKIYVALRDSDAEKHGLMRIVDESGDDYLYPRAFFRAIALPQAVRKAVFAAA